MKKTVLHDQHLSLGAKMAPFGGFVMPIQYEGIVAEHTATRTAATVFDTCHMGEFHFHGPSAVQDLDGILTCPVAPMEIGQCRYGFICNPEGGVMDDQILYRLSQSDFFMIVNAGTQDDDFSWVTSRVSAGTEVENVSEQTGKIDLQGPGSARIMHKLMEKPIEDMRYYFFKHNRYGGEVVLTSRTGYTGELGFEIYSTLDACMRLWNDCLELGAKPAGLGARDTLRLEMGFPLYGHELSTDRNAAESGFLKAIAKDKTFVGSKAVLDESRRTFRLVGLELHDRRAARAQDTLTDPEGNEVGFVTSGSFAPSLGKSIAMGYVTQLHADAGTPVVVRTGRSELQATVCGTPFYKAATARKPLAEFL